LDADRRRNHLIYGDMLAKTLINIRCVFTLNVPAEGLSPTLQTVGTTYDLQVLYPTAIIKDLKTQGGSGSFTAEEAFAKVLFGTGLSYKFLDSNTITVYIQRLNCQNRRVMLRASRAPLRRGRRTLPTGFALLK
jgi:Secretin and TonB N terminus short domain